MTAPEGVHRIGLVLPGHPQQRFIGLGARHGLHVDQSGRSLQLGADRAYTGPDCPPDMLELGGIPQGDYAPVPWLLGSRGWAAWIETDGPRRALRPRRRGRPLHPPRRRPAARPPLHARRRPLARLRAFLRADRLARRCSPSGRTGTGRAATSTTTRRDVEDDFDGYREHDLPLDAIVLDSPWATQYNTWEFNPHQFPDARGDDRALARRRRAHGRVGGAVGEPRLRRRPVPARRRVRAAAPRARAQLRAAEHFVRDGDGEPLVAKWWMGTGSPVDFTTPAAEEWWREQAKSVLRARRAGHQGRRRRGLVHPRRRALRRRDDRRAVGLGPRAAVPPLDAARARRGAPRRGRAVRAPGLDRPAGGRASPGAATSRRTSGRCARWSPRR